jgi:ribonuclease HI
MEPKPRNGIAVDATFNQSKGSGEYRGIDIETNIELFRHSFSKTTIHLQEFFAIVHALKYNKENGKKYSRIYSDSVAGIVWVENWEVTSELVKDNTTTKTWEHVANCLRWLSNNTKKFNVGIEKWVTGDWGENPADFGYKRSGYKEGASTKTEFSTELGISKDQLRSWIKKEEVDPFCDITLIARLKRDFKL